MMRRLPWPGYVVEGAAPRKSRALERLATRGWYFNGYWQAETFIAQPDAVRRHVRDFLDTRSAAPARHDVLIHYRTYKDEIHPHRRGAPGSDFIRRALAAIDRRGGAIGEVALISDDPALAMERLSQIGQPITPLATGSADADMALMLRARALILSNSSFSWWGGFCGDAKTVIYPVRGDQYHYPTPASRFICL